MWILQSVFIVQTGTIVDDSQTFRDNQPHHDKTADKKPDGEKLVDNVNDEGAEPATESKMNVDSEDTAPEAEPANDKPTAEEQSSKPEPTEEIEVEVEEFYVKYKNL